MWPSFRRSPCQFLTFLAEQPLGFHPLPRHPDFIWVTEPERVLLILSNSNVSFRKNVVPPATRWMLGDGTAASDYGSNFQFWETLRPAKKTAMLPLMAPVKAESMESLVSSMMPQKKPAPVDVYAWCHDLFFASAWEQLFGCELTKETLKANHVLRRTSQAVYKALRQDSYFDRSLVKPNCGQEESLNVELKSRQNALDFLLRELERGARPNSIAATLRDSFKSGKSTISVEAAWRFAVVGLLMASYENVAAIAAWALWLLAKHKSEQENLVSALKSGDSAPLDRAINETLRLYPPVWSLARQAAFPVEMGAQTYEAGTWFFISPWVQGRSRTAWELPLAFRPQRWLESEASAAFILPFGTGNRRWPGEALARSQLKHCLALLLSRWEFDVAASRPAPVPLFGLTQRPKNGVWLHISPRR